MKQYHVTLTLCLSWCFLGSFPIWVLLGQKLGCKVHGIIENPCEWNHLCPCIKCWIKQGICQQPRLIQKPVQIYKELIEIRNEGNNVFLNRLHWPNLKTVWFQVMLKLHLLLTDLVQKLISWSQVIKSFVLTFCRHLPL